MTLAAVIAGSVVVGGTLGYLTGRSVALVPAALGWPLYYVGLKQGWWGSGNVEDASQLWAFLLTSLTLGAALFGVLVRKYAAAPALPPDRAGDVSGS